MRIFAGVYVPMRPRSTTKALSPDTLVNLTRGRDFHGLFVSLEAALMRDRLSSVVVSARRVIFH